jgi:hypothetical protein
LIGQSDDTPHYDTYRFERPAFDTPFNFARNSFFHVWHSLHLNRHNTPDEPKPGKNIQSLLKQILCQVPRQGIQHMKIPLFPDKQGD